MPAKSRRPPTSPVKSLDEGPKSPVRKTVRCSRNGDCSCETHHCKFPVYCYADPLELTLAAFAGDEDDDSPSGAALRRARSALVEGKLEEAEAAIELALELIYA